MVTHVYYSEDNLDVRPHRVFFFRAVLGSGYMQIQDVTRIYSEYDCETVMNDER